MSDPRAVECRDLVVCYGALRAVDGVSFGVERGEVVALLGPNGAGKTTTVETLEGYRRPAAGTVRVLGMDPIASHQRLVARIGVMLQRGGVYPMLAPRQVLDLFSHYYVDPEPTDALLELVALRDVASTPFRHLSGGEQQRLSLALALVGRPEVLFLDEPTAGVDPEGRLAVRHAVADLRARGVSILLTTHELAEAERLADRVLILRHGRLAASGTPEQLARVAGSPSLRFRAVRGLQTAELAARLGATIVEEQPGEYRVEIAATPRVTAAVTAWLAEREITLTDLRSGSSLEDVYLSLIGGDESEDDPSVQGGPDHRDEPAYRSTPDQRGRR